MDWQTIIIISLIGIIVMAIAVPKILKRHNVSAAEVVVQKRPKEEGWQVKFAQGWYDCQPISADSSMGLGVVLLTDRRTHKRPIMRPLSEIKLVR